MNLKTTLITLSSIAALLIVVTFYVVFYSSGGTYVVSSGLGSDAGIFATSTNIATSEVASSTTSSTLALASSSASSTASSSLSSIGEPSVTWTQGNETLSVVDASISGSQLTLGVQVTMGSVAECVPLTLRMVADEQGDLSPPITSQFTFPDTGTCNGTPGETYSAQPIVFTLNTPVTFPILLTTGGTANTLFEVMQNPDGSVSVQLPPSVD
jgi:uncharacterized protein (UPF0333 family)